MSKFYKFNLYSSVMLFCLLLCSTLVNAQLNGIYTIDPGQSASATNYQDFTSAVGDLVNGSRADGGPSNGSGISSSVTFQVADGTYKEQISIGQFSSVNIGDRVRFESASLDSSKVELTFPADASNSSTNYTLQLFNTTYVTFSKITISRPGSSSDNYSRAVDIEFGCFQDSISNCIILGNDQYTDDWILSIGYNGAKWADSSIVIYNNFIGNGGYGIYLDGDFNGSGSGEYGMKNVILHNTIQKVFHTSISANGQDGLKILDNTIYQQNGEPALILYFVQNSYQDYETKISGNNIINLKYDGIYDSYSTKTKANYYITDISNNMIISGNNGYSNLYSDLRNISYNSIDGNNAALYLDYPNSQTLNFYNNNFTSTNGGLAIDANNGFKGILNSDYNNLYSPGKFLAIWGGNYCYNLGDWQSNSGQDGHSLSTDPLYFSSSSDLHVGTGSIQGAGTPLTYISDDFDHQTRNAITPDIGADESISFTEDAGMTKVTNPIGGYCPGTISVKAILKNFGTNTLTSASIEWSVNGVSQTTYLFTGSLASGATTTITLGNYTYSSGFYDLIIKSTDPNGTADLNPGNDSVAQLGMSLGLLGTYTMGGSSPNFTSFQNVIDSAKIKGLCGHVKIKVRDGAYNEQIELNGIPTAVNKSLTFIGENNDSTKVNLYNTASNTSTLNYTIKYSGQSFINFKKMTISRPGNSGMSYSNVIYFADGATNDSIANCVVRGNKNYLSNGSYNIFSDYYTKDTSITILNSRIVQSYMGIGFFTKGFYENYNKFIGNDFDSLYYVGAYLSTQNNLKFVGNTIKNISNPYCGVNFSDSKSGLEMSNNKVYMNYGGYGFIIGSVNSSLPATFGKIYNNMIFTTTNGSAFYLNSCDYLQIYYNSFSSLGTNSTAYNYHYITQANVRFRNNVYSNTGGGYCFETNSGSQNSMNYNDYYTNSGTFASSNGVAYSNLANWKSGTGQDNNSKSVNPLFYNNTASNTNLHSTSAGLNAAAQIQSGYTKDIDGETRNSSTPDIGADEFTVSPNDAGISLVTYPNLAFCSGTSTVSAILTNYGSNALTSVSLNIKINGVSQTATSWTGTLSSGSSATVTFGSYTYAASNNIKVFSFAPNGTTDPNPINDTSAVNGITAGMSGTYTIGSGGSYNYTTFNNALTAMISNGVCGPVVMKVTDGSYNETMDISNIPGSSALNTITFESNSLDSNKVNLYNNSSPSSSSDYVIRFNGCKYVNFRKMTIQRSNNASNQYANVVEFINGAGGNKVYNSRLLANRDNLSSSNVVYSGSTNDTGNTIQNNIVKYGNIGVSLSGNGSPYETGNRILENTFDSQSTVAIKFSYQDGINISSNYIQSSNGTFTGIFSANPNKEACLLSGNTIILKNGGIGIDLDNGYFASAPSLRYRVFNNMISILSPLNTVDYGIRVAYYSQYLDIDYNSIRIGSTNSGAYPLYQFYYWYANLNIRNNIFANLGGGMAIYHNAFNSAMNYNDLFTTGSTLAHNQYTNYSNFTNWKTGTGYDANGKNINPGFKTTTDLHSASSVLNNAALVISGISNDIDNQVRSLTTPDIGADEFTPIYNDAGILSVDSPVTYCGSLTPIRVTLSNQGLATLTTATIRWYINGVTTGTYVYSGTILSGNSALVKVGNYTFTSGIYTVSAKITSVNGVTDSVPYNDSAFRTPIHPGLNGIYTIGSATGHNFSSVNSAVNEVTLKGLCGHVIFKLSKGTYSEQVTIPNTWNSSPDRTVTFQSRANNRDSVKITYSGYNPNNHTIFLDGAKYIKFKNLTIESSQTYYSTTAFRTSNSAYYDSISNCKLISKFGLTYGTAVYLSEGNNDSQNYIGNSIIRGGMYGITINGNFNSTPKRKITILNNLIDSAYYTDLTMNNCNNSLVEGNTFKNTYANNYIVNFSNCGGSKFSKNTITAVNSYGLYMYNENYNYSPTLNSEISNNMISVTGATSGYSSFYGQSNSLINIVYNSFYANSTNGYAFNSYYGSIGKLQNNIFSNYGTGYSVYIYNSNPTINYNDYFTNGTTLGVWNGSGATALSNWKSLTGSDANSISVDPEFFSNTNLHSVNVNLDKKGIPVSTVTTDIDNQLRSTSTPDIGADEFYVPKSDAGITKLISPFYYCGASTPILVRLKNGGSGTLSSASIRYFLNGSLGGFYNWTGTLASGASVDVNIGSYTFTSGNYALVVKSFNPNGVNDSIAANDSSFKLNLQKGLKGSYTVGGTSPNYTSIQMASDTVSSRGVCGNVYFNIANGSYNEQVTVNTIPGVSSTAQVTFVSNAKDSSKVKIWLPMNYNYDYYKNYVVRFDKATYVNFDSLTIERRDPSNQTYYYDCQTVDIKNSSNISIKNGSLKTFYAKTAYFGYDVINCSNKSDLITIKNNRFSGGSYAINASGLNTTNPNRFWNVEGNTIDSFYNGGFQFNNLSNLSVSKNSINKTSYGTSVNGIYLSNCDTIVKINRNYVNIIGGIGFTLYNSNSNSSTSITPTKFENNMIIHAGNSTGYGVFMNSGKKINFYHNSVSNINADFNSYGVYSYGLTTSNFMNNIFSSTGNGSCVYFYSTFDSLNYNDYQFAGSYLGNYNGSNYSTFASWKTATGRDTKSLNIATSFVAANSDLHISNIALNGVGKNLSVAEDFDGQSRGTTPDMGADEINPNLYDAGVILLDSPLTYCGNSTNVKVRIYNYGIASISSVSVGWSINGAVQTPYLWTGTLNTGDSATASIGSYTFISPNVYRVKSWTYNPNSSTDGNVNNDTLVSPKIYKGLIGTYLVGSTSGTAYTTIQSAVNDAKLKGLCGNTIFQLKDQVFNEQVKIGNIITASWKTLTIQGNLVDSTKASIVWPSSATNAVDNYTVLLDSIDYLTIKNVQIKRTDGLNLYYTNALEFRNNATNITLKNNLIKGNRYYAYGNAITMKAQKNQQYLNIKRNAFLYEAPQIVAQYNFLALSYVVMDSNTVDSAQYGASLQFVSNYTIIGNKFKNFPTSSGIALTISGCGDKFTGNQSTISNNMIDANNCSGGININGSSKTSYTNLQYLRIINNMISGKGLSFNYGLYIGSGDKFQVYNNSINIVGTGSNSSGMQIESVTSTFVYNNIFKNTNGWAVYMAGGGKFTGPVDSMDYNDLFTSNKNLAYSNGAYLNFTTWKSGTGYDANGKNRNPEYFAYNNLHTLYYHLNGFGKPISFVTKDYDNQSRSTTVPDIGADEFDLINNDASIPDFFSPTIGATCNGTHDVSIVFENAGLNTLSSATINWSVDGTLKTPVIWTGSILPGDTIHITLGTHNFQTGITNDFYAWSSMPNGVIDLDPVNDSFGLIQFGSGIFGTKTIGGTSPDYSNFGAAAYDINTWGVCGPLVVIVRDGAYNEQIRLIDYPGASALNTITFQSQSNDSSKVTLYYNNQTSTNNYVLMLDGTKYATFRKMTISSANSINSNYNSVVRIENNAHANTFKNNRIWGKRNLSFSNGLSGAVIGSYNYTPTNTSLDYDTGNQILNNQIRGGNIGVLFYTNSTFYGYESGNSSIGNQIDSSLQCGIQMYLNKNFVISKNTIKIHPNTNTTHYGINISNCYITNYYEKMDISYNQITSVNSNNAGTGIYLYYAYSFNSAYGRMRVFNNMVSENGGSGSYSIYTYYPTYSTFAGNNTYINGTSSRAFYMGYGAGGTVRLYNNIWLNNSLGMPFEIASGYGSAVDSATNNVYKSAGLNVAIWNGTSYTSIAALQAGSSKNANSYNVSPGYTSNTDLHESSCLLKDKGRFLTFCNPDIDGQQRGALMDIGADEFVGANGTWSGGVDSLWSNTSNWCSNALPDGTNDLIYDPAATYMPVINSSSPNAKIRDISLVTGQKLKVNSGGKLSIFGTFQNLAGTFSNPGGTVDYVKSSAQDILPTRYARLTVSNGIKSVNGNVTVDSLLTINSGATFPIGSNILTLKGFFAGVGTISAGSSSTLYVDGINSASITLPSALTLSVLKVNRKAGIKIDGGNISVEDSLILTKGHIYTTTSPTFDSVILLNSYTKTVETNGYYVIGYLKTAPRTLPLSTPVSTQNGITYTRNSTANPGIITVTRVMGPNSGLFNSYPLKHLSFTYQRSGQMWVINATGTKTGLNITTKYDYVDSAFALNGRAESLLNVYSRNAPATQYDYEGRTSINPTTNVIMSTTEHFTEYLLGGGVDPLPVTWLSFTAQLTSPLITKLDFSTAMEENNDRFEVERSENGINFAKIGEVKGNGNVYTKSDYVYNDDFGTNISSNILYYRLKQIDYNGNYSYSEIKKVNLSSTISNMKVFLDNNTQKLNINIVSEDEKIITIKMNDLSGKELINQNIHTLKGFNASQFDMSTYAKGLYQIFITKNDKDLKVFKVMKF